ncbi:MAG TPA: hypothetical protein VN428_23370 [Bryobacteraceae bacterium]|nr:hypothetical protein [Bryobacteraceae bacterium]
MRRRVWIFVAACTAMFAAAKDGISPRASVSDYPAKAGQGTVEIGAALLSPAQVAGAFSTDLNRGYVVVEAGVFPKAGTTLDLGPGDFMLRIAGTSTAFRPAGPKAIAGTLQRAASKDRDITVNPSVGVGYESGGGYGPYGTRSGGWSTGAGVGVGIGSPGPQPGSTDADRRTMETELAEQQIPEKVITGPVAGYLYFPVKLKSRNVDWELEYNSPAGKAILRLANPGSRPEPRTK